MSDQEAVVMCFPTDFPEFVPYKGSTKAHCSRMICQCEVWLGPEQKKLADAGVPIVCAACMILQLGTAEVEESTIALTNKKQGE